MLHSNVVLAKDVAINEMIRHLKEYDAALCAERAHVASLIATLEDSTSENGRLGSYIVDTNPEAIPQFMQGDPELRNAA